MADTGSSLNLTPGQVQELSQRLSELRHNVNNHLSLVVAAVELIRRKPDMAPRMAETISEQPDKIISEIRRFSTEFERLLNPRQQ